MVNITAPLQTSNDRAIHLPTYPEGAGRANRKMRNATGTRLAQFFVDALDVTRTGEGGRDGRHTPPQDPRCSAAAVVGPLALPPLRTPPLRPPGHGQQGPARTIAVESPRGRRLTCR